MTAALRKIDSPQPRRSRKRVAAKNLSDRSTNKVAYLPYASSQELTRKPDRMNRSQVETRSGTSLNNKVVQRANAWEKPIWLRSLLGMNTAGAIATFVLVSAVLGLYGQVVHTKQHWGREYRQLENLQKEERQVTIFNEALKNDIAQTAKQEDTGLVTPDASQMIVIEKAPVRKLQETALPQPENFQRKQALGY